MNILEALRNVLRDPERKPLARIILEATHSAFIEREVPYYYFTSLLHQRGSGDYRQFIGHKKIADITKNFYNTGDTEPLKDKLTFERVLGKNSLPTPKTLMKSRGKVIHYEHGKQLISDSSMLADVVSQIVRQSDHSWVFVKPVDGTGGKHTFKLGEEPAPEQVNKLFTQMEHDDFVFQEYVIQHDDINRIYDQSINTIRVHTYVDPRTHEAHIVSALMRFGSGGNIVDNGSSSGFFIPVNTSTWALEGVGKSYLHSGARTLPHHPDSGVPLDGFVIPFGQEVEDLVLRAAPQFDAPFIGWDIAITAQGPTIIEGNHEPHLIMAQVATKGFKNHPPFVKIFNDFL